MSTVNGSTTQLPSLATSLNQGSASKAGFNDDVLKGTRTKTTGKDSTTTTTGSDKITLSKEAQDLLAKMSKKDYGFNLTSRQQQQIQDILTKYKDSPQNDETLGKIQNDLKKLRLDGATLAARETAKENSSKKNMRGYLMALLNGKTPKTTVDKAAIAAKAKQFNTQVLADFAALKPAKPPVTPTTPAKPATPTTPVSPTT